MLYVCIFVLEFFLLLSFPWIMGLRTVNQDDGMDTLKTIGKRMKLIFVFVFLKALLASILISCQTQGLDLSGDLRLILLLIYFIRKRKLSVAAGSIVLIAREKIAALLLTLLQPEGFLSKLTLFYYQS